MRYFLGHYGDPPAPVDPQIAERVLARPQSRALAKLEPISLEGARERFGSLISEEELLLRLTMPEEQVDAMIAARDRQLARQTDFVKFLWVVLPDHPAKAFEPLARAAIEYAHGK